MIEHVYRRSQQVGLDSVVVLTDDRRIANEVERFGGRVELTPEECATGTDRIAWAARAWDCDAVINIQGDEPLIDPRAIRKVAEALAAGDSMVTLAAPTDGKAAADPNVVKVVSDLQGRALYFSRAPIPHGRDREPRYLRHIGVYGYQREILLRLAELPMTKLEQAESLEQLRVLENGIPIRVIEHPEAWPGIDTPADVQLVENYIDAHPDLWTSIEAGE